MAHGPSFVAGFLLLVVACDGPSTPTATVGSSAPADVPPNPGASADPLGAAVSSPPLPASAAEPASSAPAPLASTSGARPKPGPVSVYQRFRLDAAKDGIDGRIELLTDTRVVQEILAAKHDAGPPSGHVENFDETAAQAVIQLLDAGGAVLDTAKLGFPWARLEPGHLYGGEQTTFAVTVDQSSHDGVYYGPTTTFLEILGKRLHFVRAFDDETHMPVPIALLKSLRTTWAVLPSKTGRGSDIFNVECLRGDLVDAADELVIVFTRYSVEGGRWVAHRKRKPGLAEFPDGKLPPRSDFP